MFSTVYVTYSYAPNSGNNKDPCRPNCIKRDPQEQCSKDLNSSRLPLGEYDNPNKWSFQETDNYDLDDSVSLFSTNRTEAALCTNFNKGTSNSISKDSQCESSRNTVSDKENSSVSQQSGIHKKVSTLLPHKCIDDSKLLFLSHNNASRSLSHLDLDNCQLGKQIHRESKHPKDVDLPRFQQIKCKESSSEFNYGLENIDYNINNCENSENFVENEFVSTNKKGTTMRLPSPISDQKDDDHDADAVSDAETENASCFQSTENQSAACDVAVDSNVTDELNINNHKNYCLPKKKTINHELLKLTEENFCLSEQNNHLRQSIRNVRKSTAEECSKILDEIISYCECKSNHRPQGRRTRRAFSSNGRVGAGCSTGGCGGYTPSGWNKLLTLHRMHCEDPVCPCCHSPPSSPCPDPCEGIVTRTRRKPSAYNFTRNSKLTDENASATNVRPSAKILGELAFQLERRILDNVFGKEGHNRRRFYGYTVNNINHMMGKECKKMNGDDDPILRNELETRLRKLMMGLQNVGYNIKVHGDFAQQMINRYGLLAYPPDPDTIQEFGLQNPHCISKLIVQLARGEHEAYNFQILLRSLCYISKYDGLPLFVW